MQLRDIPKRQCRQLSLLFVVKRVVVRLQLHYFDLLPRSPLYRDATYCEQRVCMSFRSHIMSKTTGSYFTKFSARVNCGLARQQCSMLCTSGFLDDVISIGSESLYWRYSTRQKLVFTRSTVTPPKVNRFG